MGFWAIAIGIFDWFARYETGKDLIAKATTTKVADIASQWWLSPLILIVGFSLLYLDKYVLAPEVSANESPNPSSVVETMVEKRGNSSATSGNASVGDVSATATGNKIEQNF